MTFKDTLKAARQKTKLSLHIVIYNFFIFFLTYHALNQIKNVDQSLSFVQKFSELMQKTFSTQGIFNFSSSSKLLFAGKIALFALAALTFVYFALSIIINNNLHVTKDNEGSKKRKFFKNGSLNLLTTKMIKTLFVAFVPFLIPVLAVLYNQDSKALMICSLFIAAWYLFSEVINDKNIYDFYNNLEKILNNKPISYCLEKDCKTTKLFNLLKTLPSTIIDGVYEAIERLFIGIIDCFLAIFERIDKGVNFVKKSVIDKAIDLPFNGVDFCIDKISGIFTKKNTEPSYE